MQSDPIGLEGGENSFIYVGDNPLVGVDERGLLIVYIWDFRGSTEAWGHASMTLEDGTHISWWPMGGTHRTDYTFGEDYPIYTADPFQNQTLKKDIELEGKRPDHIIIINSLDEIKIKNWWIKFKKNNKWKTFSQNCSTTVAKALDIGEGSKNLYWVNWNIIWTPNDVKEYAEAIAAQEKVLNGGGWW